MSSSQYPPPPYAGSPAPQYQEPQHGAAPPEHVYHGGSQVKGTGKQKKTMIFVVIGFGAIFLGAFIHDIASYFIDPGNGYDAMGFIGTFLQQTGALGSATALTLGSLSFKEKWVKVAMILAAVFLVSVFLVSTLAAAPVIDVPDISVTT